MRAVTGKKGYKNAKIKKLIFLGLDGLDPALAERDMSEGKLPNLSKLKEQGGFSRLRTTFPALSPVAWSTFATGVNPARHNIFDFLTPDLHTYHPKLSSVDTRPPRRNLRIGKYVIPLGKADVRLLRKSKPFWEMLGKRGIFNSVIRVPITYPPEKLRGVLLSAMCVPDLRGTQGMFAHYTTKPMKEGERTGGEVHHHRGVGKPVGEV